MRSSWCRTRSTALREASEIGVIGFKFYREDIRNYVIASGPANVRPVGDLFVGTRDRQAACSWSGTGIDPLEDQTYQSFMDAFQTIRPLQ